MGGVGTFVWFRGKAKKRIAISWAPNKDTPVYVWVGWQAMCAMIVVTWGLINIPGPQVTMSSFSPFSGTYYLFVVFQPLVIPRSSDLLINPHFETNHLKLSAVDGRNPAPLKKPWNVISL